MKLITKELETRFAKIGRQDISDPTVIAKFFNPCGVATWYVTEYNPETKICFGYVTGLGYDEWGDFSIEEMESIKCPPLNLPIERDLYCGEKRISEFCPELAYEIKRRQELQEIESQKEQSQNNNLER